MEYEITDFTRCPSSECDQNEEEVAVDYYFDGNRLFFNFMCQECETGSLEDDFRWYVRCPNCKPNPNTGVDRVSGTISSSGVAEFECENCGSKAEDHVRTRWDSGGEEPSFEPYPY